MNFSTVKPSRSSSEKLTHPNWLIRVGKRTTMKLSTFYKKKTNIVEPLCK